MILSLFIILLVARYWLIFDKHAAIIYLAPICAALLIMNLGLILLTLYHRSQLSYLNRRFLAIQSGFWGLYLLLIYPGFYNYDSFRTLELAQRTEAGAWQSHLYGFLCSSLAVLDKNLFLIPLFSVLISLFIYQQVLATFLILNKRIYHLLFLFAFWPLHIMTLPFLIRDVPFGLLTCALLFFLLPFFLDKKKTLSPMIFLNLLLTIFITNEIRQDGVINYLIIPFVFMFSGNISLKKYFLPSLCLCLVLFCANLYSQQFMDEGYRQRYEITALIHPINAIYYSKNKHTSHEDDAIVNKIIDIKFLENEYYPILIQQLHENKHKLPVSDEDWQNFKHTYLKLILKNWPIFLYERFYINLTTFGFLKSSLIFADTTNNPPADFQHKFGNDYFKKPSVLKNLHILISESVSFLRAALHYFTLTRVFFLGPVGLLLAAFYLARRDQELYPFFKVSMGFILVRSFFVFFLSPEPHLTYYSPLIYFPFFFIVCAVLKNPRFNFKE